MYFVRYGTRYSAIYKYCAYDILELKVSKVMQHPGRKMSNKYHLLLLIHSDPTTGFDLVGTPQAEKPDELTAAQCHPNRGVRYY